MHGRWQPGLCSVHILLMQSPFPLVAASLMLLLSLSLFILLLPLNNLMLFLWCNMTCCLVRTDSAYFALSSTCAMFFHRKLYRSKWSKFLTNTPLHSHFQNSTWCQTYKQSNSTVYVASVYSSPPLQAYLISTAIFHSYFTHTAKVVHVIMVTG